MGTSVLISGAGVAGSTLAYWLARHGFRVTAVERAAHLRSSGNPVDVKGPAVAVVEEMGIWPQLKAVSTEVRRLVFVDATGRPRAGVNTRAFQGGAGDREIELARADLASILLSSAREHTDIRWGDTITGLAPDDAGVDVTFEHAEPARFDLVVGADGVHSTVRRLAFGPEAEFTRNLGMYIAALPVDRPVAGADEVIMYNTPGRALSVHPGKGAPLAAFMFRHPPEQGLDYHDIAAHKRLVTRAFAGRLGSFDRFLGQLQAAPDLFFDAVTRVVLPHWTIGNITLVGDAASSLSLFGDGSTLAIAGAHTLATELARTPDDPAAALQRYEQRHRRRVRPRQYGFAAAGALLVPKTRAGIAVRDNVVRVLGRLR
jgi:2-polyprenyl-6-methoxyphenol hydroxylase-like FAD-dependent oxidoreductase